VEEHWLVLQGREELGFRSGIVWLMPLARSSSTQVYAFIDHLNLHCLFA
jgi:hypothetical protein